MTPSLLDLLTCPFCGDPLTLNDATRSETGDVVDGLLRCYCCVFPIVDGIPVMLLSDATGRAIEHLSEGRSDAARLEMLASDAARRSAIESFVGQAKGATFRDALNVFYGDGEGDYTLLRFTDPTFIVCEAV